MAPTVEDYEVEDDETACEEGISVGPYVYYTAIVSGQNTTVEIKTSDEAELAELVHRSLEFMKHGVYETWSL